MTKNNGSSRLRRRCGAVTRVDLMTVLLAVMLCSASYWLGIWHNSRGAADSRVLRPGTALTAASACGGDEPLDFEAHHTAEGAGLSVSVSSSSTPSARRALRGAAPGGTGYRHAFTRWTTGGGLAGLLHGIGLRFGNGGAIRA